MWRTLKVGEVFEWAARNGATVVAGADGMERSVTGANVAPSAERLRAVGAHELAITTATVLRDASDDAAGLLAGIDAAGIAVADGAALPDDLLAAANALAFPIIAVPNGMGFADVTAIVFDALLAAQRESVNRAFDIEERFAAITLEELVSGHGDVAEVVERAAGFGWDLERPRAVLLASIDPIPNAPIPPGAVATLAATARATLGRDSIVWTRSTAVAALLAPQTDAPVERRGIADRMRAELDERLRSVNVSIGVGRRVDAAADLHRSFVEATNAVFVGRWAKGRHVTQLYDELGLERLLAATPSDDLAEFVQRAIGPIVEYDRDNQSELVETLAVWLATRNVAEAARVMQVHYNTVKNRLERIETIIGPVIEDSAHALECEVAMHVYRHYDGPWKPAADASG